eukprot:5572044-Alexandrium_andersonii.AAC.1
MCTLRGQTLPLPVPAAARPNPDLLGMSVASTPPDQCVLPFNYVPAGPPCRKTGQEVSAFMFPPGQQDP